MGGVDGFFYSSGFLGGEGAGADGFFCSSGFLAGGLGGELFLGASGLGGAFAPSIAFLSNSSSIYDLSSSIWHIIQTVGSAMYFMQSSSVELAAGLVGERGAAGFFFSSGFFMGG